MLHHLLQYLTMTPGGRGAGRVALRAHGFRATCTAGAGRSHLLFSSNPSALLHSAPEEESALERQGAGVLPAAWESRFTPDWHHLTTQTR